MKTDKRILNVSIDVSLEGEIEVSLTSYCQLKSANMTEFAAQAMRSALRELDKRQNLLDNGLGNQ